VFKEFNSTGYATAPSECCGTHSAETRANIAVKSLRLSGVVMKLSVVSHPPVTRARDVADVRPSQVRGVKCSPAPPPLGRRSPTILACTVWWRQAVTCHQRWQDLALQSERSINATGVGPNSPVLSPWFRH